MQQDDLLNHSNKKQRTLIDDRLNRFILYSLLAVIIAKCRHAKFCSARDSHDSFSQEFANRTKTEFVIWVPTSELTLFQIVMLILNKRIRFSPAFLHTEAQ